MVVMEELGRGLMPEPMILRSWARRLMLGGSAAQQQTVLPGS
jgi:hypothetical protein